MPLTVYSVSEKRELDVEQVLYALSKRFGHSTISVNDSIPDSWQQFFHTDLECPCCFVTGAELVKPAVSRQTKQSVRQACFRFVTPGHHPHCDYAVSDNPSVKQENLIDFGNNKSALTRAVRELVCSGITNGAFSQKDIRDMRQWFFQEKNRATFLVTLDYRIPKWLESLWRVAGYSSGHLPQGIPLTREIAAINGFDWSKESARILRERHEKTLAALHEKRLWLHQLADRVELLAKRNLGINVFDPTILQPMYQHTLVLAEFMTTNYAPFRQGQRGKSGSVEPCVLALSALLLFVNKWQLSPAISEFARISALVGRADPTLGNVMGLNPFHDFAAWKILKQLQDLGIDLPGIFDVQQEKKDIEKELRARFQV